jgi:hypothetical protein
MKLQQGWIVGLAGVSLVACGVSEVSEEAASAPVEEAAAPESVETAPISTRLEAAPACDSLGYDEGRQDCVLVLGEDMLVFFDYGTSEGDSFREGSPLTIAVNPVDGVDYQSFEETVYTPGYPELADVNNDGQLELMVPTSTGNVNTSWSVYQQLEGGLAARGSVSGLGLEYNETSGLASISARSSAASWVVEHYLLDETGLEPAFTRFIALGEESETCEVLLGPAFERSGLDLGQVLDDCELRGAE